ncbi:patatin-like phospholipase family protein [Sandaracinus amylolyticus]|uniref:patatin-like phospholipase family protein n=1 Tax=Sandaracinus amylolyticus TaxID=927083 RepID=UPI001F3D2CC5|nr:patatin-like phospholipase family protein [Sandaracinus amylolyticus]UJR78347.1 Patatin [Sandaracinus amylolyticus]
MARTFDVVFEGGGARGLVLNGAIQRLEEDGHRMRRLVGTSAGAIAASLVAAGFSGDELVEMSRARRADGLPEFADYVSEPVLPDAEVVRRSGIYSAIMDAERKLHVPAGIADTIARHLGAWLAHVPGLRSAYSFVEHGGVHSGDGFTGWLVRTLDHKRTGLSRVTLGELHARTGRHLTVIASDSTAARMLVLNHVTAPDVPLVSAVRMSMSIPLFFDEVIWRREWGHYLGEDVTGHVVVDGGLLSNFPLRFVLPDAAAYSRAFMGDPGPEPAEALGLFIDQKLDVPGAPPSRHSASSPIFAELGHTKVAARVLSLVETMLDGNDDTVEEAHEDAICRLPAKSYFATEFHMERERVDPLIEAGRRAMEAHLESRGRAAAA